MMFDQVLKFADEHKNAIEAATNIVGTVVVTAMVGWVGWSWVQNAKNGEALAEMIALYEKDVLNVGTVTIIEETETVTEDARGKLKAVHSEKEVVETLKKAKKEEDED